MFCQCEGIILRTYKCHTGRAYLIHWKEEDCVIRRDDMIEQVSEPAVGDVVKTKVSIRFARECWQKLEHLEP